MPFLGSLEGVFGYGRFITAVDNVFSPSDIFGLGLWMDATTITGLANNASVTTWNDRGPYRLVGFGCNNPIYQTNILNGLPVVQFNAAQIVNFGNFLNLGTGGLFIAGVMRNAGTSGTFVAKFLNGNTGANGRYILYRGTTNQFLGITDSAGNRISPGYANANTQVQLYEAGWDRATVIQLSNGSTSATSAQVYSYNASNAAPLWLGAHADNTGSTGIATYWLNGYIAELVLYLNFPSTYERQQIEGYLAWKWGLQTSLPTNHPFRNSRPTKTTVAFQPTMLSNLQGWFDGSDPLATGTPPANGASVGTWFDKSGWARNATGGTAGFYSNTDGGMVRFNGSSTFYPIQTVGNTLINQYFTVFVVERLQATASISRVFVAGNNTTTNGNLHILYDAAQSAATTMKMGYFGNDLNATSGIPAFTNAASQPIRIWTFTQTRTSRSIYLNGSNLANNTNNTLLSSWAGATIGRYQTTAFYMGNYHELLMYTGSLPYYDQQEVEGYLAWKWGLQTSLPSWHPFRSVAPSNDVVSFQPTMVANLQGWYDASDPLATGTPPANGATVPTWFDKSFSGRNMAATTAANYSNAEGGFLNFNGSSTRYTIPANLVTSVVNQYFSIFFIERLQGAGLTFNGIIGGSSNTANNNLTLTYVNSTATQMRFGYFGNDLNYTTPAFVSAATQPIRLWSFTQRVSDRRTFLNGSNVASDTNNTLLISWAGAQVGYFQQQNSYYRGHMFDLLFYNGAITFFDQIRIEGYLAWKWGLQNNLYFGHPFRSAAPTTAAIPFIPSMLFNLTLWLDAADSDAFTLSGSSVDTWIDKSGRGNNATQATADSKPTRVSYGSLNAVDFDGTDDFLDTGKAISNFFLNSSRSIFVVGLVRTVDTNNTTNAYHNDAFLGDDGGYMSIYMRSAGPTVGSYNWTGANSIATTTFSLNTLTIFNYTLSSSTLGIRLNGGNQVTAASGNTNVMTNPLDIGRQSNNNAYNLNGQIMEMIIYSQDLTFTQRQVVEGYLAWKWGIQNNLPIGHPYKGQAPTSANIAQF